MTKKELIIETIMAASGQTREYCVDFLERTKYFGKDIKSLDQEIPEHELSKLREGFAKEMPGILASFVKEHMVHEPHQGEV